MRAGNIKVRNFHPRNGHMGHAHDQSNIVTEVDRSIIGNSVDLDRNLQISAKGAIN